MLALTRISKIQKRDGRIVDFDRNKIADAVFKAAKSVGGKDKKLAEKLADQVAELMETQFKQGEIPTVEQVQDLVEKVLIENGHARTAKSYILYREKRAEIRKAKAMLGVIDDLKLPLNAITILEKRYLKKDENGRVIESTRQMVHRVAHTIAAVDILYGKSEEEVAATEKKFFDMTEALEFLPNSPTLMNAGIGSDLCLSACFVLPVEDSIESIFDAVKNTAIIHKAGGGTGFSFSRLRPRNDVVKSTGGVASGPLSFMRVFDVATEVIKQGGRRRGANMGILRIDHSDILDFITCKEREGILSNFNISVGLTKKFMDAVENDEEYELISPRSKKIVNKLSAKRVLDLIVTMAWKNGEPGIIFLDRINDANPTPTIGEIESTNPCGEQPLLPYESCNLGSINLSKMIEDEKVDWEKLGRTVMSAVHFLDNVIDANKYPLPEIEHMTKANRKIGLGVMGFADMLIMLDIPYNSEEAVETAEKIMRFISEEARNASEELAKERGSFPNFEKSVFAGKYRQMRNATVTTIAPTGTIGIIAGCSSGIEPLFAISYMRNVAESIGKNLIEINQLFENYAIREGIYSEELMEMISRKGSIQKIEAIPEKARRIFVTAHDILPEWHIKIQAAFQKYTDNAVSKTVNFPSTATPQDIEDVYMLAYKLGCKGVTVYRDKSREVQVITTVNNENGSREEITNVDEEYNGGCKTCNL